MPAAPHSRPKQQGGWPVLGPVGARASASCPQLHRASCAHKASRQGFCSCCGEQVCPFQAPLRSLVVSPWSRTMLICSGFSFHPENPRASSSPWHFLGTLLLPPPHLPEGRLAQNWPRQILPALNPVRQAGDAQVYWAQSKAVCQGTEVSGSAVMTAF